MDPPSRSIVDVAKRIVDEHAVTVLAVVQILGQDLGTSCACAASMMAASQYEIRNRRRVSRADLMTYTVFS